MVFLLLLKQIEALLDRIGDIVKIIAFPGRVGPDLPDRERGFHIDDILHAIEFVARFLAADPLIDDVDQGIPVLLTQHILET